MFQAIVHAPALRPGARLCISDYTQTVTGPPARLAAGAALALRYGACCPGHGAGAIAALDDGDAILLADNRRWRLRRCRRGGGIDLPGLVAETWFVVDREG